MLRPLNRTEVRTMQVLSDLPRPSIPLIAFKHDVGHGPPAEMLTAPSVRCSSHKCLGFR
jgi:hypothetical protein